MSVLSGFSPVLIRFHSFGPDPQTVGLRCANALLALCPRRQAPVTENCLSPRRALRAPLRVSARTFRHPLTRARESSHRRDSACACTARRAREARDGRTVGKRRSPRRQPLAVPPCAHDLAPRDLGHRPILRHAPVQLPRRNSRLNPPSSSRRAPGAWAAYRPPLRSSHTPLSQPTSAQRFAALTSTHGTLPAHDIGPTRPIRTTSSVNTLPNNNLQRYLAAPPHGETHSDGNRQHRRDQPSGSGCRGSLALAIAARTANKL
jgi:hypothetical protein